jgi:flagellar hook-basal body complex protein FliE
MSSVNMNSLMAARNAILNQNNALQDIAKNAGIGAPGQASGPKETAGSNSFSTQLTSALQEVNKLQSTAEEEMKAYQMGESNDVAAVMLAKHKASLGFETTLQVRNKLLSAYKDIMNMPV